MKLSMVKLFKRTKIVAVLAMGLMLCNPVTVKAEELNLTATVAEGSGTAYVDDYMNDEALTSSSRAVAAEYFGVDSKDVQLLADFGVSFSENATLPASVTVSGIFDKSYAWSAKDGITLFSVDDTGYTDKVSYIYADGDIRFTATEAGHFFVAKDSGKGLRQTELKSSVNGYTITVTGNMPKGAALKVKRVYKTAQLEEIIGNEDYQVYAAFDIEILVGGQVWQPADHGESVSIDITGVDIPKDQEVKVYRIEDEAVEAGEAVSDDSVVEVESSISEDGNVVVETDHFTVYTVGGVEYNLAPKATGTWLGMTYETFDSDGDGTAETLVLSGTQTQEMSSAAGDSNYYGNAPYYQNDITTVSFQSGTKLISGCYLFRGCSNLTTIDTTNADVSNCTTFYRMFYNCSNLTSLDVSGFNTSSGTDFSYMFYGCSSLTSLDVSGFNTSKGTNFNSMFYNCNALTSLDVSSFNTSSGTDFSFMFYWCSNLANLDVSGFNTSSGTTFNSMFNGCKALTNLDVSKFNTSNGTYFGYMFGECSGLTSLNINGFNTSKSTSFSNMFNGCKALTSLDVSSFDTSNVTDFGFMFSDCQKLTSLDVSGFNTSKGTNFRQMYYNCKALTSLDLSGFDTSNGTNFSGMFNGCKALTSLDVSKFDTSNGTNFRYMFSYCSGLTSLDVSSFDTSNGTDFEGVFSGCSGLTSLDLSSFDTSNATSLTYMLTVNTLINLQRFSAPKTNSYDIELPAKTDRDAWYLDDADPKLEADTKTAYTSVIAPTTDQSHTYIRSDIEGFSLPVLKAYLVSGKAFNNAVKSLAGTTNAQGTALYDTTDTTITAIKWSDEPFTSEVNLSTEGIPVYARIADTVIELYTEADKVYFNEDCSSMFRKMEGLVKIDFVSKKIDTSNSTKFQSMFDNCRALTSLDISCFDTSKGTNFNGMFFYCKALTSLDVSDLNTSNGTNFSYMFRNCDSLTSLDVSGLDTSNGTNFQNMFSDCNALTSLDVSGFNTSNGENFSYMFSGCKGLTSLDVSGFDTSNGTDFRNMFYNCNALTSIDVSGFNTSNGTNFRSMFSGCSGLTNLDVSGFNTSNGTDFGGMFYGCKGLTGLDVSGFDTSKSTNFASMFWNCKALTSLDVSGFNTSNGTNFSGMFWYCSALTNLDVSGFNTSNGTEFGNMFYYCQKLTNLDVSGFDTSKGTSFNDMFYGCSGLTNLDLSSFDTSKVTSSSKMFTLSECNNLQRFSAPKTNSYDITLPAKTGYSWYLDDTDPKLEADTKTTYTSVIAPVTDQPHTYIRSDIAGFSLPVLEAYLISGPEWRTALYELAGNSYSETSGFINGFLTYNLQTETSDGSDVIENTITDIIWADNAFNTTTDPSAICVSTSEGVPVYARMSTKDGEIVVELYTEADVVYLNSNCNNMFQCYDALETISFLTDKIDASRVTRADNMFAMAYSKKGLITSSLPQIKRLDLSRCTFENTTTFCRMFYNCNRLVYLDIHNFETTKGKNFSYMFSSCSGLTSLDVSSFNTSNGTSFACMFSDCSGLTSLDVSKFNTSKGTDFYDMFYGCSGLTSLDVSSFDTSSGTNFHSMFSFCSGLTNLNLSGFNTSNGTDFSYMFQFCSGLTSLNVSSFNTSKGTDFRGMFSFCSSLTSLDVSGFDTSKVTSFDGMFTFCRRLTSLNIRNFTFSDSAILDGMFAECDNLSTIYGLTDVTSLGDSMFMTSAISWSSSVPYINDNYAGDFDAFWESEGSYFPYSYDEAKAMYESASSSENSLTVLYFADYEDFTSDCWFDYDWAADGRSVCIYDVSIPAVAGGTELSTDSSSSPAGSVDVAIEKFVSDEAVEITTSPVLKLTSTTNPNGYLTYMFTQEDTSKTYNSLKDEVLTLSGSNTSYTDGGVTENATGPKYSAKEDYVISIFKGQDQNLKGQNYTGNLVLNFKIAQ